MTNYPAITKAIIPAAGLGTRLLPITKAIPKELIPIVDKPIIQHVVDEAIASGIKEIILITRAGKEAIENHFDVHYELEHRLKSDNNSPPANITTDIIPKDVQIASVRQPHAQGLGHAIACAKNWLGDNPFAVLLPDILTIRQQHTAGLKVMNERWQQTGRGQIMLQAVPKEDTQLYGIAAVKDSTTPQPTHPLITGLVEKPSSEHAPSNLAVVGRYILPADIFPLLAAEKKSIANEIQLTGALHKLAEKMPLEGFLCNDTIYDCGHILGFLKANLAVACFDTNIKKQLRQFINHL